MRWKCLQVSICRMLFGTYASALYGIYNVLNGLRLIGKGGQMNRWSLRVTPEEQEGTVPKNTLLFCRICWKNTFDLLTNPRFCAMIRNGLRDRSIWAHSSAGRAPRSQCGGQGFDPPWVHQLLIRESEGKSVTMVADFSFLSPPQYAYAARQGSVGKSGADYNRIISLHAQKQPRQNLTGRTPSAVAIRGFTDVRKDVVSCRPSPSDQKCFSDDDVCPAVSVDEKDCIAAEPFSTA